MKRTLIFPLFFVFLACSKEPPPVASAPPTPSSSVTGSPLTTPTPPVEPSSENEEALSEEDFEDEALSGVSAANLEDELSKLEKELSGG